MKFIIVTLSTILLFGCGTPKLRQLHYDFTLSAAEVAIVSSDCNKLCKNAIEGKYFSYHDKGFLRFTSRKPSIRNNGIQKIDQLLGTNEYRSDCNGSKDHNIWNEGLSWGYNFEMLPGSHTFQVFLNDCRTIHTTKYDITVELIKGHTYGFTQVLENDGSGDYGLAAWYPVLYDYTDNKIVHGFEDRFWFYPSKY
ncbi:MAG: hypothetical protein L3J46_07965 [Kangiellaceae bacterium]|nr:hypothetical protein [Kangiellaceae bacterium]